jgi:hypothetical protein
MQQSWSKRWITLKYIYPVPAALCRSHMPLPCGTGNNHGMASSTLSHGPESLTQQHRSAHLEQDHHMALGGGREQLEAQVLPEPLPMRWRLLQHVVRGILHAPGMHRPCQLLALLQCRPEGTAASRPRGDEAPRGLSLSKTTSGNAANTAAQGLACESCSALHCHPAHVACSITCDTQLLPFNSSRVTWQ